MLLGQVFTADSRWWLIELNAALSALLLVAGIGKLYLPGQLTFAIRTLLPPLAGVRRLSSTVRVIAVAEVTSSVGLLVGPLRVPAASVATLLGLGFVAFGLIGWLSGSEVSCGCFATAEGHPLGPTNVAIGAVVAAIGISNWLVGPGVSLASNYTAWSMLVAAANVLLLATWGHRQMVRTLLLGYLLAPGAAPEEVAT